MTVPYNILSLSKKWRSPYKSRVRATLLFFNCRKWDYNSLPVNIQAYFYHIRDLLFLIIFHTLFDLPNWGKLLNVNYI